MTSLVGSPSVCESAVTIKRLEDIRTLLPSPSLIPCQSSLPDRLLPYFHPSLSSQMELALILSFEIGDGLLPCSPRSQSQPREVHLNSLGRVPVLWTRLAKEVEEHDLFLTNYPTPVPLVGFEDK